MQTYTVRPLKWDIYRNTNGEPVYHACDMDGEGISIVAKENGEYMLNFFTSIEIRCKTLEEAKNKAQRLFEKDLSVFLKKVPLPKTNI